jgi:hypothetical protein
MICQRCEFFVFLFREPSFQKIVDNRTMMQDTAPNQDSKPGWGTKNTDVRCNPRQVEQSPGTKNVKKEKARRDNAGQSEKLTYALIACVSSL